MRTDTIGSVNSGHKINDVIISEIMYHPVSNDSNLEFIELYNQSNTQVNLSGWRIDNAVKYIFPLGTTLNSGSVLLLVGFDIANITLLNAFIAEYSVPAGALILGPFDGALNNGGERVQLERPDSPPAEEPTYTPYITMDEVKYNNVTPWDIDAAGGGESLGREFTHSYGDVFGSWIGMTPSAGVNNTTTVTPIPGDIDGDGDVDGDDLDAVKQEFGNTFSLADLFSVRNNSSHSRAQVAQAAMIPDSIMQTPQPTTIEVTADVTTDVISNESNVFVQVINNEDELQTEVDLVTIDLGSTEFTTPESFTREPEIEETEKSSSMTHITQRVKPIDDEVVDLFDLL